MREKERPLRDWRSGALVFEERAAEYDTWFEKSLLFGIELAALRPFVPRLPQPRLEVGVGPGRFARELGVAFGIDPSLSPLQLAGARGISCCRAIGEELPLRSGSIGSVLLLFTLCFVADPSRVLRETHRVLRPDGRLLLGMVPAASSWGRHLAGKKAADQPFYRHAAFRTVAEVKNLLAETGFQPLESTSTLFQPPAKLTGPEEPRPGACEEAGFVALLAAKLA